MKSFLVISSVLLVSVALGANAYRINNNNNNNNNNYNNQDESNSQWFRFQQTDSSDESFNLGTLIFDQKTADDTKINNNNDQFNRHTMNNDNSESTFTGRQYQTSQQDQTHFGFSDNLNQQQQLQQQQQHQQLQQQQQQHQQQQQQHQQQQQQLHGSQNQATSGQNNGLAKKIVDKIAAIQQIAVNHNIANNINYLNGELEVARDSVKLTANNFVSFYNTTMNNLDNGDLKCMYLNPEQDTMFAQYHFNQIKTVGSFKSDVRDARSGYYTIVMNNVYSNLSTGFYEDKHSVVRSAKFENAVANIKTQDGSETQVFNPAVQRFLRVLANAVSSEVKMSARNMALVQIKNEITKPIVFQNTENNKLFDLMWQEGNIAMEMPNIGFQNSQMTSATEQLFKSMTFQRKSQDSSTMRYEFTLNNLEWISTLTVMSAGKNTVTTPATKFNIEKIDIQVVLTKSIFDQQQSCDKISANVEVQGLNYNLKDNLRSEVASIINNNLQSFIEHCLESNIQTSLKQKVCNNNYNKY